MPRVSTPTIYSAFDWYWSDGFARDSARSRAVAQRRGETGILVAVVHADSIVSFGLWSELPASHPVGELWLETQTDILATIYLAYGGFFRQAFTILRTWFELSVAGVFFSDHYRQPTSRYVRWRQGERQAPANMQDICHSLAARPSNNRSIPASVFLAKLDPLYSFLSKHAHGQGLDVFDLQDGRDNVPRFLGPSWDLWFTKALEVFDARCFLHDAFFVDPLAAHFASWPAERRRARLLARRLAEQVPIFAELIARATAY
jgi:hypothetical protein